MTAGFQIQQKMKYKLTTNVLSFLTARKNLLHLMKHKIKMNCLENVVYNLTQISREVPVFALVSN